MATFLVILLLAALVVAGVVVLGRRRAAQESFLVDREAARIRQEARDASWEIHRRVSGALTEMMEAARDAQRRGPDQWT
jgi:hypothetical protein